MPARSGSALLIVAACVTPALAEQKCIVGDPTGTPLNVRAEPNGAIRGALNNMTTVRLIDTVTDGRGRRWSLVEPLEGGKTGWVFRDFVSCY